MKRNSINKLLIFATSVLEVAFSLSFTACNQGEAKFTNTKDALLYIANNKNYTITYKGDYLKSHSYVFTSNSIGRVSNEYPEVDRIYVSDSHGTYLLTNSDHKFYASEYKSSKGVWSSELAPNLKGVGKSFLKALDKKQEVVSIKDKDYRMAFVSILGYERTDFIKVDNLSAKYDVEDNTLTYNLTYDGREYVYVSSQFNVSKNSAVDSFLAKGGKPLKLSKNLSKTKELFFANNYRQDIWNYGEDESTTGYVGTYFFNPHYFGEIYYGGSMLYGYISLQAAANKEHPELKGCYQYYVDYSTDPISAGLGSRPISDNPDITYVMNYPSYLRLWDKLEYMFEGDQNLINGFELEGESYSTRDLEIIYDVSNNFNMDSFEGQEPYAVTLDIVPSRDGISTVYLYYSFLLGNNMYTMPFKFYKFAEANIAACDQLYEAYND